MTHSVPENDQAIQESVLGELRWDSRVLANEIGVAVEHGVVRLTGTVSSLAESFAAEEAAHRVPGVLDVANEVRVRPQGRHMRNDFDIAEAVRRVLTANATIPGASIRSSVTEGHVVLEGEVMYLNQRSAAEDAIRHLGGVRAVSNLIKVKPPTVTSHEVRNAIASALARRANHQTGHVNVDVDGGVVTLSGIVQSWGRTARRQRGGFLRSRRDRGERQLGRRARSTLIDHSKRTEAARSVELGPARREQSPTRGRCAR